MDPPYDTYKKFYVYDVRNPAEVIQGDRPIVVERGPYSYVEKRSKVDISHGEGLGVLEKVQFGEKKTYFFDEATSCESCTKDDIVTVINAPLVVFMYQFASAGGILESAYAPKFNAAMKNESWRGFCPDYGTHRKDEWVDSLFMDVSVDDLIFNGVKPGVVNLAFECFNNTKSPCPYDHKPK